MDDIREIARLADGAPVFRRRHVKSDGREVLLYGYDRPDASPVGPGLEIAPGDCELRWHPLRQEWNVYAAARQNRTFMPGAAADPLSPMRDGGPATEVPFETFEIAVFENRFPSFRLNAGAPAGAAPGIDRQPAVGHCDVVVFTADAEGSLASLSQARRRLLVEAWIDRYEALFAAGCAYVLPFESRGRDVGVTLPHPHGQIYGFCVVPTVQARTADAFAKGYDLAANMQEWHEDYGVADAGGLLAFAPPFARFPYEVWICPFTPKQGPWEFTPEEKEGFARLLGDMVRRYDAFFGRETPYMLSLHAAPKGRARDYHFTAQFYPLLRAPDKLKYLASVEQSTAMFTVDVMPEAAAAALRDL